MAFRSSLVGHTTVYALGLGLQGLGALLVLPLLTRSLGPEEYGRVAVAIVVMTVVALLVAGGVQLVVLAEFYRDSDGLGARALASAVAAISLGVGAAALLILALIPSDASVQLLVLSVLAAAGLATVGVEQALFRAMQKPGQFLIVTLASTVGAQAVGLAGTQFLASAEGYMAAFAMAVALTAFLGAIPCKLVVPWRHWVEVSSRRNLIAPVLPQTFAMLALTAGDIALVSWVLGDGAAGRYQVAWLLGSISYYSASALGNAWSPRAMEQAAQTNHWQYLLRTGRPALASIGVVAVLVAAISPVVLPVLAPPSFDPDGLVGVVAILALTGPMALLYVGSANVLFRQKQTPLLLLLTALGASALAVVALLSIPHLGLVGAAAGKVVGLGVLGLSATVAASRAAGPLMTAWRVAPTMLVASAGCLAAAWLPSTPPGPSRALTVVVLVVSLLVLLLPLATAARSVGTPTELSPREEQREGR